MSGTLHVVGLGPGDRRFMTQAAIQTLQNADIICGYHVYTALASAVVPETPVFTLAEVHDEDKRDLAEGRRILVSSDAHRLWEISDGSFCVHLDIDPEAGEEAVRKALFVMLEKKS